MADAGDTSNTDKTTFIWMANIVEALEKLGAPLEHVYFTQGCPSQLLTHKALQLQLQTWAQLRSEGLKRIITLCAFLEQY